MPRYRYYCSDCKEDFIIFHGIEDSFDTCTICKNNTITRLLSTPIMTKNKKEQTDKQVTGKLTNDYIKLNKDILEEEKLKAMEIKYESD